MARPGVLVRDYIREALCGPGGYFSGAASPVIASPKSLPFRSFRGAADYRAAVAARYASGGGDFATPVDLFAPWYSYAVARWALAWHRRDAASCALCSGKICARGWRPPGLTASRSTAESGAVLCSTHMDADIIRY